MPPLPKNKQELETMAAIITFYSLFLSSFLFFLQVPVGRATLGRIMNVIGEPIDEKGDLSKKLLNL